jgi:hypothetical protein
MPPDACSSPTLGLALSNPRWSYVKQVNQCFGQPGYVLRLIGIDTAKQVGMNASVPV